MTNSSNPDNAVITPEGKENMDKHNEYGSSFYLIQQAVGKWAKENFGDNVSKYEGHVSEGHPLGSLLSLMGMAEEICGELMGCILKRIQGRDKDAQGNPKSAEQHKAEIEDALADCLIFMSDFACRENIDLYEVFSTVWAKQVSKRKQATWNADKAKEHPGLLITNTEWPWPAGTLVQAVGDEKKTWTVASHFPRGNGNYVVNIFWKNPSDASTQTNTLYSSEGYRVVGKNDQLDTADNYCNNPQG